MWGVTVAVLVVAVALWILWRKKHFSYLKELGIPGPEPSLLFGNQWELSKKTPLVCHKEWAKRYGKVFGYYMGTKPIVVVADAELLKKIQVSEFHKFINRPRLFGSQSKPQKNDGFSYQMTNLRDKRWKEIRSMLTPSFTTSKMKLMTPIINTAIDTLIENIDEKAQKKEAFDIYKFYQGLTMDVIGRTAFGIQTDCQRNPNDPFLRSARVLLGGSIGNLLAILAISFPELGRFWKYARRIQLAFRNKGVNPIRQIIDSVKEVVKTRRDDESKRRNDLLQLMIDARMSAELNSVTSKDLTAGNDNQEEPKDEAPTEDIKKVQKHSRYMEDYEVVDNAIMFFLAGYETTSTALAFSTHFLVHYPDIQEKIREEVKDLMSREGSLDYVSVQQLQYLDQVINESLRMYPPIYLFVNREAGEDVQYGNLRLKKGLPVQIPTHLMQHDEDYWPDPETFDPDRFSPHNKGKNHPLAFQAFGAGPRNCVGMRFAQMEAKLALARILHKYSLVPCDRTEQLNIDVRVTAVTLTPRNGVHLMAIPL